MTPPVSGEAAVWAKRLTAGETGSVVAGAATAGPFRLPPRAPTARVPPTYARLRRDKPQDERRPPIFFYLGPHYCGWCERVRMSFPRSLRMWLLIAAAIVAAAAIALLISGEPSTALEDRVYRVDMTTGEGLPARAPPLNTAPPAVGEWVVLVEPDPAIPEPGTNPPVPQRGGADFSFGHVIWSFVDGEIIGQAEVPVRGMIAEIRVTAVIAGAVRRFVLSASYTPPSEHTLIGLTAFWADSLGEHMNAGAALGGPRDIERQEGRRAVLDIGIDPSTIRRLIDAEMITIEFETYTDSIGLVLLDLVKGETGAAVFEDAFAAWGLVP